MTDCGWFALLFDAEGRRRDCLVGRQHWYRLMAESMEPRDKQLDVLGWLFHDFEDDLQIRLGACMRQANPRVYFVPEEEVWIDGMTDEAWMARRERSDAFWGVEDFWEKFLLGRFYAKTH